MALVGSLLYSTGTLTGGLLRLRQDVEFSAGAPLIRDGKGERSRHGAARKPDAPPATSARVQVAPA
jgi:hypothetical protein